MHRAMRTGIIRTQVKCDFSLEQPADTKVKTNSKKINFARFRFEQMLEPRNEL